MGPDMDLAYEEAMNTIQVLAAGCSLLSRPRQTGNDESRHNPVIFVLRRDKRGGNGNSREKLCSREIRFEDW